MRPRTKELKEAEARLKSTYQDLFFLVTLARLSDKDRAEHYGQRVHDRIIETRNILRREIDRSVANKNKYHELIPIDAAAFKPNFKFTKTAKEALE